MKAFTDNPGRNFDDVESDLSLSWESARGASSLNWQSAKQAARDTWDRLSHKIEHTLPGDSDGAGK